MIKCNCGSKNRPSLVLVLDDSELQMWCRNCNYTVKIPVNDPVINLINEWDKMQAEYEKDGLLEESLQKMLKEIKLLNVSNKTITAIKKEHDRICDIDNPDEAIKDMIRLDIKIKWLLYRRRPIIDEAIKDLKDGNVEVMSVEAFKKELEKMK